MFDATNLVECKRTSRGNLDMFGEVNLIGTKLRIVKDVLIKEWILNH